MNTAPRSTRHLTAWTIRRVTRNTPVVTSHPYDRLSHAELQGASRPSLITSVNPIAVQPIPNVEEDIERYISHNIDDGRWFCTHCNKKSDRRRNRIRDHVAACLGYEIYRCTGKCGNAMWYVTLFVGRIRSTLEANISVAAKSNAKRVRIFVSTKSVSIENARSGTSNVLLGRLY